MKHADKSYFLFVWKFYNLINTSLMIFGIRVLLLVSGQIMEKDLTQSKRENLSVKTFLIFSQSGLSSNSWHKASSIFSSSGSHLLDILISMSKLGLLE